MSADERKRQESDEKTVLYGTADYRRRYEETRGAAALVASILLEHIRPLSVIDIGCGVGAWLHAFREKGVEEIYGIDGEWVDREYLQIPEDCFHPQDLAEPIRVGRSFDLVICLEVAEHLPQESAPAFVRSLMSLGPCVLFSAAIPHQTGKGHVNEQWPDYWADLFSAGGYVPIDLIRRKIWRHAIPAYYKQNIILYAENGYVAGNPGLAAEQRNTCLDQLNLVHPDVYLFKHDVSRPQGGAVATASFRSAVGALVDALRRKLNR